MASNRVMPVGKLRLLALHSFRTSAITFQEQVRRSGLDRKLDHLIELVYIDAPHAATGPPPQDVAPFFEPPYREWWRAEQDKETGEYLYRGGAETLQIVRDYIRDNGPFDGFWAFSQGSILATLLTSLHSQGKLPEAQSRPWFVVLFGGFFDKEKMKHNRLAQEILENNGQPINCPSMHIIGERDALRKYSRMLAQKYKDGIVIMHPRGHVIPALNDESYDKLENFLKEQRARIQDTDPDQGLHKNGSRL